MVHIYFVYDRDRYIFCHIMKKIQAQFIFECPKTKINKKCLVECFREYLVACFSWMFTFAKILLLVVERFVILWFYIWSHLESI